MSQQSSQILDGSLWPRLSPPNSLNEPQESGWPEPGQIVHWQAHIFNRGDQSLDSIKYVWQIEDAPVDSGEVNLQPGENIIELSQAWQSIREQIGLTIKKDTTIDEIVVTSNALSVGLWIEQSIYDWMIQDSTVLPFEQWARRHVSYWDKFLKRHGVIDRLRLDRIVVLPSGSPYPKDIDTDFQWYFSNYVQDPRFLHAESSFYVVNDQIIVLHELLHQRGLIDIYAYEVLHDSPDGSDIKIKDPDGRRAVGTERMPLHDNPLGGFRIYYPSFDFTLMGRYYHFPSKLSEHSTYGLNLFATHRTPRWLDQFGNSINLLMDDNPYITHVPKRTVLLMIAPNGEPINNIYVDIFLDWGQHSYQDLYSENPDFILEVDSTGMAVLPSEIWTNQSWIKRTNASVLILRARKINDSAWGYAFLPIFELNMAFIEGAQEKAQIPVTIELR